MGRTLILGMGLSGQAALKKLYKRGERDFLVIDKKEPHIDLEGARLKFIADQATLEPDILQGVEKCILSPGVGPSSRAYQLVYQEKIPVMGEMEFGLDGLRGRLVMVTGSNGKSTTVTLAAHLLRFAGKHAQAVGNIGIPLCAIESSTDDDIWIVEASSYHLETIHSQRVEIGIVLNITENHLDRYGDLAVYAKAKSRLQDALIPSGRLWLNHASHVEHAKLWYWPTIQEWDGPTFFEELTQNQHTWATIHKAIAGKQLTDYKSELSHDVENVKVALAICLGLGLSLESALGGLDSYVKLPHRLERVQICEGISFINDSKSTSVAATMHALEVVEGPLVLIAGGVHKGASYTPWHQALEKKGVGICVIGQAADLIRRDLESVCPVYVEQSLQEAVAQAWELLRLKGEGSVLFSPGCASFDMFSHFEDRGNKFKQCIQELKVRGAR